MLFEKCYDVLASLYDGDGTYVFLFGDGEGVVPEPETEGDDVAVGRVDGLARGVHIDGREGHPLVAVLQHRKEGEAVGEVSERHELPSVLHSDHLGAYDRTVGRVGLVFELPSAALRIRDAYRTVVGIALVSLGVEHTDGRCDIIATEDAILGARVVKKICREKCRDGLLPRHIRVGTQRLDLILFDQLGTNVQIACDKVRQTVIVVERAAQTLELFKILIA